MNKTIHDVAKEAQVSVATVSRVLNNHSAVSQRAKEAVLKAIQKLNYAPNANAKALAKNNTDFIGVVVTDVVDPFFGILVKSIDKTAEKYHKSILIGIGYHNEEKEKKAIENLLEKRCSCLVVHAKALPDDVLIAFLKRANGMVIINRVIPGFEDRCVNLDNQKGTLIATELLIKLGHRHIAYIGSNHQIADEEQRLAGYMQGLENHQIPLMEEAIVRHSPDFEGGEQAMIQLLTVKKDLTAVVTYNDTMAAGAISVLNENNLQVPQDVSIIGFDDMPIARYLIPKLTTIRYPIDLMATYAAELALSLVDKNIPRPHYVQFNPTLVKRFSVSPL